MVKQYYNMVMDNNLLLSGVVGLICTLLYYIENKRTKNVITNISYLKVFVIVTAAVFLTLYLKNTKTVLKESSVKIGEPDF